MGRRLRNERYRRMNGVKSVNASSSSNSRGRREDSNVGWGGKRGDDRQVATVGHRLLMFPQQPQKPYYACGIGANIGAMVSKRGVGDADKGSIRESTQRQQQHGKGEKAILVYEKKKDGGDTRGANSSKAGIGDDNCAGGDSDDGGNDDDENDANGEIEENGLLVAPLTPAELAQVSLLPLLMMLVVLVQCSASQRVR